MCIILGIGPVQSKLSTTIGVIIVFSFFIEVSTYALDDSFLRIIFKLAKRACSKQKIKHLGFVAE